MKISEAVNCLDFSCLDTCPVGYVIPEIDLEPADVSILMISEAAPEKPADYFYAGPEALFARTTLLAFQEARAKVSTVKDILDLGVYLTTAVKCAKTGYAIATQSVQHCSFLLEKEIALFPNVKAYLLMGDVAIQAINMIAKRNGEPRVIPSGSTYKIRGGDFHYRSARAYPSYLQAGPSFFIEKRKRKMIAEDIATALAYAG